ncbi:MAG: hypothetical protein ACLS34_00050 [Faecalibacterium sp.]
MEVMSDETISNSDSHNHAGQFIRLRNKFATVILHRILCFHIGIKSTRFFSELEDMETSQILEELKISDGGYTEDCFSVLSKRLVEFPEDTLCILNHNKLMADTDFEALVITGIGAELPYIGAAEEKDTLYKYLKSISTDEEYAEIASRILDEWLSESDGS